jgi:hypothetical protein
MKVSKIPFVQFFLVYSYITIDQIYDFEFEHDYKHLLIERRRLLKRMEFILEDLNIQKNLLEGSCRF